MPHKLRRLFRGSGRALALIFAASVLWVLFDMAALRLSFSSDLQALKAEEARARKERAPGSQRPLWRGFGQGEEEENGGDLGKGSQREAPQPVAGVPRTSPVPVGHSRPLRKMEVAKDATRPQQPKAPPSDPERGWPPATVAQAVVTIETKMAPKGQRSFAKGPQGRKELREKDALELPPRSRPRQLEGGPPLPSVTKFPGNRTRVLGSVGSFHGGTQRLGLPTTQVAASKAAEEKGGARKGTPLGKGHREDDTRVARAKEILPGNPVVLISKEEARVVFPTLHASDAKGNRGVEKNVWPVGNKSRDHPKAINNGTRVAGLTMAATTKALLTKGKEREGTKRVSLVDKDQLKKINHSDSVIHFQENTRLHKVLSIDRTLGPRDPNAPGQFGRPAEVPGEKQEEAKRRWNEGNFNVYLSDLIPVDRAIDDTRPIGCSDLLVHNDLPTTSIIMCFVDEVWSTLLRSVHSVLNRSPPQFIKEIILVDDFSTKAYLKDKLDSYMAQFPKVRILHLKERHGLIRARLAGAEIAKGDVLTFLDSHVECNVGWLEPLLERIHLNRKKVPCPVIEVISDKDMSYMTVDSFQRGIFTWPMNFGWKPIPPDVIEKNKIKETDIIRCPVMAGGLFSIDKKYFFELGTYDPGLDVWGGENMEISFKVWMCGGEIEIIPCSRVGHIFRNDNPYSFPKDRLTTVERNLARVAEVWLDEYKDLFYGHGYHLIKKNLDVGDLTQQKELRKQLQCKSFK
ncbi:polypeptide N-acetylgalactosaminyltransferase 5 isoform X2 [Sceloporus undulatus]|nr:polypeptide N-acetylgalactosaminyltransferase 5 isoform X2 [Sceloporus undulatus]